MAANTNFKLTPEVARTIDSLGKLEKIILNTLDFREVVQKVVDSILIELGYLNLGYKVVVLALVDEQENTLKRISLSQTEEARKTREVSNVRFEQIVTPMTATENLCIKAVLENKPQITHYFPDILTPPVSPENALASQKNAGIKTSLVYPLNVRNSTIGVMIFSMVKGEEDVTDEERILIQHFVDLAALAVQNSKLYSEIEKEKTELAKANENLKKLDKLKDDFISVASHELRTPMTIIKNNLWMIVNGKKGELNEKQSSYIDKSMKATDRMLNLINDILDVSKIEGGRIQFNIERIKIGELITEVVTEFKETAETKGLTLTDANLDPGQVAYADLGKVREILTNLIGNSMKFTEQGGIKVSVTHEEDKHIKIAISDTGKGIHPEDVKRLFHKFERLENSYQKVAEVGGTGLGLYIVKLYVESMGGKVGVDSEGVGKGSTFWFTLPTEDGLLPKVTQTSMLN